MVALPSMLNTLCAMNNEEWRAVVGFEGFYEVSDHGNLRSLRCGMGVRTRPRAVKHKIEKNGYHRVALSRPSGVPREAVVEFHQVARVVLTAFVGPGGDLDAAHENGHQHDNRLSNLAWKTRVENLRDRDERHNTSPTGERCTKAKLTAADVAEIKRLCASGVKQRDIARQFGVWQGAVSHIMCGRTWSHINGTYNRTSKRNLGRSRPSGHEVLNG